MKLANTDADGHATEWVGVCCSADGTDTRRTRVCATWREAETLALRIALSGERVRAEPADGIGGMIELMD
jgi:hypothetical protein